MPHSSFSSADRPEQHFREDLSPELLIPQAYARTARSSLLPRMLQADRGLARLGLEAPLRRLILEPVWYFIEQPEERISFGELFFLRDLVSQLMLFTHPGNASADSARIDIHHLLVSINFNSAGYFEYFVDAVRKEMCRFAGLRERLKVLTWCRRELKAILPSDRRKGLRPGSFTVRDQLLVWLEEERIFIRYLMAPVADMVEGEPWSTRLTVPQAALMARVYMEEGLVRPSSLQQVFTSLADMLGLRKSDTGAEDAFRSRYQHPSLSTITACKQWMMKVLDRLNDYELQLRRPADH